MQIKRKSKEKIHYIYVLGLIIIFRKDKQNMTKNNIKKTPKTEDKLGNQNIQVVIPMFCLMLFTRRKISSRSIYYTSV